MGSVSNSLVLSPATQEDIPAIVDVWFDAFTQPVIGKLFPDTPGMRQWFRDCHTLDMQTKPLQKYVRVVDEDAKDAQGRPRLVAFGKWDLSTPEERGRRFPLWHIDSPFQDCENLIKGLDGERKRVMGDQKHYYLDTVGTHPNYQRRGAGSMIVKWGCDLADHDGVAAYVDASKEGAPLYKRFGFEDFSKPDEEIASMARAQRA
ncbi:hypothetical protein NUU61_008182 [Penicillium alfredii]|uniref:N-acetyltransferase domain-containing protein n=1 Tax=Penicillium alfredii TaxID=1506179 RepID=A0A9W9ES37_9EURO|nr:uncharacterized protein NUU61_008182 [Penicillium alfredii]KAJ5086875.1 hypothetical protein NUU61_008182 [Penicillium alfredii]